MLSYSQTWKFSFLVKYMYLENTNFIQLGIEWTLIGISMQKMDCEPTVLKLDSIPIDGVIV